MNIPRKERDLVERQNTSTSDTSLKFNPAINQLGKDNGINFWKNVEIHAFTLSLISLCLS
jgi:hypothetical protein